MNLDALKFIAAQTAARGLHFQLGIWTHAYQWTDSPNAYHRIEGLTAETHAAYCRDALAMLLKECPEIQGLTMRVHGESGIPEGSYDFWRTLFEAIKGCGRTVEIDMHAKGVDEKMIDIADGDGNAGEAGSEVFRGAPEPWVSAGGHSRAGDSEGGARGAGAVQPELGCAVVYAVWVCGFSESREPVQSCCSGCGRARSGIC